MQRRKTVALRWLTTACLCLMAGGAPAQPGSADPAPGTCRPGPAMEPREYTQPEVLGRPAGDRARMCFYRLNGSSAEYLQFYPSGHFLHTSITGSGGFAMGGAVHGTVRGTYGFRPDGLLATRIGYQGTGVSQSNRGAGSGNRLDVAAQGTLENEVVLPNCQRITTREETRRVHVDRGANHPPTLVIDGVRWEHYRIDCPSWQGWVRP